MQRGWGGAHHMGDWQSLALAPSAVLSLPDLSLPTYQRVPCGAPPHVLSLPTLPRGTPRPGHQHLVLSRGEQGSAFHYKSTSFSFLETQTGTFKQSEGQLPPSSPPSKTPGSCSCTENSVCSLQSPSHRPSPCSVQVQVGPPLSLTLCSSLGSAHGDRTSPSRVFRVAKLLFFYFLQPFS